MKEFSKKPAILNEEMKHDLKVIFSISLGLFLFVLFFQPFELIHLSFNNKLLFLTGLGAIIFLIMVIFQIILPFVWPKFFKTGIWENEPVYLISSFIWIISSVAVAFYIRYVGLIELSMYLVFKIIVICIAPVVVVQLYNKNQFLRHQNHLLHESMIKLRTPPDKGEKEPVSVSIEIASENKAEKIALQAADLVYIKSADNYIEIVYRDGEQFKKKLIRNTLRNIEDQLSLYPVFIRCHRTCIINIDYIEKLAHSYTGQKIVIKGYDVEIPVSRQYLLRIKEASNKG